MALTLGAVARAVGGTCVLHGRHEYVPVDGLARISQYVVVANPAFVTLVTGSVAELRARLDAGDQAAAVLSRAVLVSPEHDAALSSLLSAHQMTGIVGATSGGEALHAQLSALVAEDQAAADRLVAAGTKVLTQVARRGGVPAVIAALVERIDGWAVLLDASGHLIASAGAGRLHIDDAVAAALGRPVRVRHQGLQIHQVGSERDHAGYLVVASRSGASNHTRELASQAAALFDLVLRTRDPSLTEHLGREALLDILLAGGPAAAQLLVRWGVRDQSLTGFAIGTKTRTVDLERLIERWFDELGCEHVFVRRPTQVRGFLPDSRADDLAQMVASAPADGGALHLGLGSPAPVDALRRSAVQATQALSAALEAGRAVLRHQELSTIRFVLDALDGEDRRHLAGVLDGLRDSAGQHGELTKTLHVYLHEHENQRSSAVRLGIHRQTLVQRIARIEKLTDLSLDRPDDRATAWLALRALGR